MLQMTMNALKRWRLTGVLLAVLAPLALMPAGAGAQEGIDAPPVVTNVTASPSSLPAEGGLVTIFADASDENGGVTWVQAEVTGPFGGPETVLMGFTGVGQTYSGSFTIPANFTDSPMKYSVIVQAIDLGGNSTWEGGGGDHRRCRAAVRRASDRVRSLGDTARPAQWRRGFDDPGDRDR